ncbi:MAG TPA: gliding motility-associated C-terminal domain-containing protein, partial [Chitinophagales bacterium]|nr:gliding motility-associated C-terminal domain-containing protein [Chitinophagales bacterium]
TGSRCYNTFSGTVIASVSSGGIAPFTFMLNGVLQSSDTFTHLAPGDYTVLVSDGNGCNGSQNFNISSSPPISVNVTTDDRVILTGMQTQLVATASPADSIVRFTWDPDSLIDFSGCANAADCSSPYAAPLVTTTFTVTAWTADSCYASDTITINVSNEPVSFIPTAFTPNGDNLNDQFHFAILGATSVEVTIFDRWGQQVYYNANQANGMGNTDGWDGKVNGSQAPAGTYVYQLKISYYDGTVKNKTGTVTLMR